MEIVQLIAAFISFSLLSSETVLAQVTLAHDNRLKNDLKIITKKSLFKAQLMLSPPYPTLCHSANANTPLDPNLNPNNWEMELGLS